MGDNLLYLLKMIVGLLLTFSRMCHPVCTSVVVHAAVSTGLSTLKVDFLEIFFYVKLFMEKS